MNKKDLVLNRVNEYTKFKIVEMLIEKHQDRFKDFENMEELSEDILKVLALCGLKFHNELKEQFDAK